MEGGGRALLTSRNQSSKGKALTTRSSLAAKERGMEVRHDGSKGACLCRRVEWEGGRATRGWKCEQVVVKRDWVVKTFRP